MVNLLICSVALLIYISLVWYAPPRFWRENAIKMIVLCVCLLALFSSGLDNYRAEQTHEKPAAMPGVILANFKR